ncbi:hypothetical protein CCMSSC00406_0007038 [Pleurotus cornucopiae]|uniref:Uncharacterized protein n=1 Tax=Pleurotus cornucopiae TaxID=5321 RepID=A0ACB7J3P3_PLECO|nr:hypothetical protein CCMSSC00406_0007038 [Pleurotus cornucopiae]
MSQNNFFPSIGAVAEKADNAPENEQVTLDKEADVTPAQEIESLCMKCGEQGITRMLLTSIPYFREVIVMSFRCEHCGATNNEVQSAGEIRPEGISYTVRVLARPDLNRQIVRSATCDIAIPEYQLTLPASSRGQLTTVEGLIRDVVADLSLDQPVRKYQDPENYTKIQTLIGQLREILADEENDEDGDDKDVEKPGVVVLRHAADKDNIPMPPFTIKLDDPSGNSFIEFVGNMADPKWTMKTYARTFQQNVGLGLVADEGKEPSKEVETIGGEGVNEEIFVFHGTCSSCGHPLDTMMKKVNIPYFKDIIIMSTNCDRCGYRDNEVKSGSAISEQGKRITLKVEDKEDLSRDILKSETAGLTIPEIDLVLSHGTLGGRFTTLEGILEQVYEELSEKVFANEAGDSKDPQDRNSFETFLKNLKEVRNAERPFTLILDDPLANSYVQNLYAPDPDPNMQVEMYDRTFDQNEELGLNDIKVEGYENDAEAAGQEKEEKEAIKP